VAEGGESNKGLADLYCELPDDAVAVRLSSVNKKTLEKRVLLCG